MRRLIAQGMLCTALLSASAMAGPMLESVDAIGVPILSPMSAFGGGDGWLAPGDRPYLTTNDNQSGLAFNPATGNLLLVNRAGGVSIPILNSATGADLGTLNAGNIALTPGIKPLHMIGVAASGQIYGANLSDGAHSEFHLYEWNDQSSTPFLSYRRDQGSARIGDSLDVTMVGGLSWIVASAAPGINGGAQNGYFMWSTSGGAPFSIHTVQFPSNPPAPGDHRLGLIFLGNDRILGTQGGGVGRLSSLAYEGNYGLQSFSYDGSAPLTSATERPMDYAVIDGTPVLATVDTATSIVRLYDMTNPNSPVLLAQGTNIVGPGNPNAAGVGQVQFGDVIGNTATLYALNANNGIQAFNVVIPEPGSAVVVMLLPLALFRRNRRRTGGSCGRII